MTRQTRLQNQTKTDNRWNTPAFPAVYCCCSLAVAVAVAQLRSRRTGLTLEQISSDRLPALREILWDGRLVDMTSAGGIQEAGFPHDYPAPVTIIAQTQGAATLWHTGRREGVVCRSHALYEIAGERVWHEPHQPWGEVAVFTQNAKTPQARRAYLNPSWLKGASSAEAHQPDVLGGDWFRATTMSTLDTLVIPEHRGRLLLRVGRGVMHLL